MKVHEVFGISNEVLVHSYVDRGQLDQEVGLLLEAGKVHIALRGPSKCGKSWLRRRVLDNPNIVHCRLKRQSIDLYMDALSQLGIEFKVESTNTHDVKGTLRASGEVGLKLLAKVGLEAVVDARSSEEAKHKPAGRDINDLKYVAEIIKASGRKLVIEDFHYLSLEERTKFAFELKAFWDWGVQVVIIGVWNANNLLLALNPDLAGRVKEISIDWSSADLRRILEQGGAALNMQFVDPFMSKIIELAYGNAGQLQMLVSTALSEIGITEGAPTYARHSSLDLVENAAMEYAEQLNPRYQTFADRVASGIRKRTKATNIYAHTMAVIMKATDEELVKGLSVDAIFAAASEREPRILLGNLKTILTRIESLQVDEDGRGLVLAYNTIRGISVVDRQLLLYRKYATVKWPWEEVISEGLPDGLEGE